MIKTSVTIKKFGNPIAGNREGMNKIALTTAKNIAEYAKRLAPVDTGDLRNSIEASQDVNGANVTTGKDYDKYVEFGTRTQQPQPFMRPAGEQAKNNAFLNVEVADEMGQAMKDEL